VAQKELQQVLLKIGGTFDGAIGGVLKATKRELTVSYRRRTLFPL